MGVWDSAVLCEIADAEAEIGSLTTILQVTESDRQGVIDRAMKGMKREFAETIKSHIPDIYARYPFQGLTYTQWYQYTGYTYLQTDSILDLIRPAALAGVVTSALTPAQIVADGHKITMPELTTTATAMFIARCLQIQIHQFRASALAVSSSMEALHLHWMDQAKGRWKDAKARLWIDLAQNGAINDEERVRTKRGFYRG